MTSSLTRIGTALVLALSGAALAGCGTADPQAAAIVDGAIITQSDLEDVRHDLGSLPGQQMPNSTELLGQVIVAKLARVHAGDLGLPDVSADAARSVLEAPTADGSRKTDWSPATIEAARDAQVLQAATPEPNRAKFIGLLHRATITVNPRYGSFDAEKVKIVPVEPNWLAQPSAPQTPAGRTPQEEVPQAPQTLPDADPNTPASPAPTATR